MKLALFDLDNTLLEGDSDYLWGQFLIEHSLVDREYYKKTNNYYHEQYMQGKLDIYAFLEFAFTPLKQYKRADLNQWRENYIKEKIQPIIREKGQKLIETHRAKGHTLVIITATNSFVTAPIAKLFNVPYLLATEPEIIAGEFTGKVQGTPCFQEGKITNLQQWITNNNFTCDQTWFYSDSRNDIPLLSQVDYPCAVDPDPALKFHAKEQGWPVISLAKA